MASETKNQLFKLVLVMGSTKLSWSSVSKYSPSHVQNGNAPIGPSKKTSKFALNKKAICMQMITNWSLDKLMVLILFNCNIIQYNQIVNIKTPYLARTDKLKLCGDLRSPSRSVVNIWSSSAKLIPKPLPAIKYGPLNV